MKNDASKTKRTAILIINKFNQPMGKFMTKNQLGPKLDSTVSSSGKIMVKFVR